MKPYAIFDGKHYLICVMHGTSADDALAEARASRYYGTRPEWAYLCSNPMDTYGLVRAIQAALGEFTSTDMGWAMLEALEERGWVLPEGAGLARWVRPADDEWGFCLRAAEREIE